MKKPFSLKQQFIENIPENNIKRNKLTNHQPKKAHRITISLSKKTINTLESLIDRATLLGKRTKTRSDTIRMAIDCLNQINDKKYLELYDKK